MGQILLNFEEYGYPHWIPIQVEEMQFLYTGAQGLIEAYSERAIDDLIKKQSDRLWLQAVTSEITPVWVSSAILLMAVRGLRGEKLPEHYHTTAK